ncbi:hypothetical protein Pelo_12484 [Pelomyxa schiedti]|nr:hypothetical protein Pelo_12484 [Pelomyxa schiedti]
MTSEASTPHRHEHVRVVLKPGREIHALRHRGTSPFALVLVHGMDRRTQNAECWAPHFEWLVSRGIEHYAVDLLGHGDSTPGGTASESAPTDDDVPALCALLAQVLHEKPVVLLGRSYGGYVVSKAAAVISAQTHSHPILGIVLIAPAIGSKLTAHEVPTSLSAKPVLLIWAVDDAFVPFSNSNKVLELFKNARLVTFPAIQPTEPTWKTHCPEVHAPAMFQQALEEFLNGFH